MEATKLTVNPELIRFQPMERKRRTELRRKNIIDLITSKPFGTVIRMSEFAAAASCTENNAYMLINTMVKRGVITREKIGPRRIMYVVNGEPRTVKPADATTSATPTATEKHTPPAAAEVTRAALHEDNRWTIHELEQQARNFVWESGSSDVREFIVWISRRK